MEKAEGAAAGAAAEEVEAQHLSIWIPIVTIMGIYSLIVSVTLVVSCVSHWKHTIKAPNYFSKLMTNF